MTATQTAADANEAIRTLNHATIASDGHTVGDVYEILAELHQLAYRLGQTSNQLGGILAARLGAGGLRIDEDAEAGDAFEAIASATVALTNAGPATEQLANLLSGAQQALPSVADNG